MNSPRSHRIPQALLLLVAAILLGACDSAPSSSPPVPQRAPTIAGPTVALPQITVTAYEFAFQAPESISGGYVRVKLVNAGREPHHLQIMRLNEDVTSAQFQDALKQGEASALSLVTMPGGIDTLNPGATSADTLLFLPPGDYILACFVKSSDGISHAAKGMVKPLQVTAAAGQSR